MPEEIEPRKALRVFDDILTQIGEQLAPEQVFDEEQLEEWAAENGYVLKEEKDPSAP